MTEALCPACHSSRNIALWFISADEAAQHFVLKDGDPERNSKLTEYIKSLWGASHCQILSCEDCGFGFSNPYIAGDAEFFNLAYPHVAYPTMKWDYARTLTALKQCETAGKRALDAGSGFGHFLDLISVDLFHHSDLTALEYNETSLEKLRAKGYSAMPIDIRDDALRHEQGRFDFIFLFQVVQHMDRLEELFERINFLLAPGGLIFIAVPNQNRINYQENNGSLLDTPPNHVGRWTETAFTAITARHGLKVLATEVEPFNVEGFLKEDIIYSHSRRAQRPGTLSSWARSLPRGKLRTLAEAAVAAIYIPTRLDPWREAIANREKMGLSLWVQIGRA